jgi:hypothetical protein
MTNPYTSSSAAAPSWSPPKLTVLQIVVGVCVGVVLSTLLAQLDNLFIYLRGEFDPVPFESNMLLRLFLSGLYAFVGGCVAACIGSIRVLLPMLLIYCMLVLYSLTMLRRIAMGQIGEDQILAHNLPNFTAYPAGLVIGAVIGHAIFKYRRRPRYESTANTEASQIKR